MQYILELWQFVEFVCVQLLFGVSDVWVGVDGDGFVWFDVYCVEFVDDEWYFEVVDVGLVE